jgi:hypothetical protein
VGVAASLGDAHFDDPDFYYCEGHVLALRRVAGGLTSGATRSHAPVTAWTAAQRVVIDERVGTLRRLPIP